MTSRKDNVWVEQGGSIQCVPQYRETSVDPGIYQVVMDPYGSLVISRISDQFKLPTKIYNVEEEFINRVIKSYNKFSKNLGVLLNGIKGSGKTITAKIIAQKVNLPVLLIEHPYEGLPNFLSKIDFNCVIFIDEYEKVFSEDQRGLLLSVMDGAQNPRAKLMFLLTTNSLRVNENLRNRPSRVRYVKEFGDLPKNTIYEILNDLLENKDYIDDTVRVISELSFTTMDSIIEIIKESNVHEEAPSKFIRIFNISQDNEIYKYNMLDRETGELLFMFPARTYLSTNLPCNVWMNSADYELYYGSIKIIRHIDEFNFEIEFHNTKRKELEKAMEDREENVTKEICPEAFDEDNYYDEDKDPVYIKLKAQYEACPPVLRKEVRRIYVPDKNWQFR